jgi:hypothetical protein
VLVLDKSDPTQDISAHDGVSLNRTMRLEASTDGRSVLLVALDARKPGSQREWRVEITPEELIALIRAHGTEVSGYLVDFEIQVR